MAEFSVRAGIILSSSLLTEWIISLKARMSLIIMPGMTLTDLVLINNTPGIVVAASRLGLMTINRQYFYPEINLN